jgi:hypothetical protein
MLMGLGFGYHGPTVCEGGSGVPLNALTIKLVARLIHSGLKYVRWKYVQSPVGLQVYAFKSARVASSKGNKLYTPDLS